LKIEKNIVKVLFLLVAHLGFSQEESEIKPMDRDTFFAGEKIILTFSDPLDKSTAIYFSSSYGSTFLQGKRANNKMSYELPDYLANKSGVVYWRIINAEKISGQFTILPKNTITKLETYVGPPSIIVGGKDFSMLVVIPTDSLDNPTQENRQVFTNSQFYAAIDSSMLITENLIAFKRFYSSKKSGRLLLSTSRQFLNSKEFTVDEYPAIPTDFSIYFRRNHGFADGNQITTFYTSVIKDAFENIVIDGTYVTFIIKNSSNAILQASGLTINGVATAKMIHPVHEENWEIKALVYEMADSNVLNIAYQQAINDFETVFSPNNRKLTIGPLQSFMKQIFPDGCQVTLMVYKGEKLEKELTKTSNNGYVSFHLKAAEYKNGTYTLNIKLAGLKKEFKNCKLW
jgi:hypothetical protein